MTEDAAEPNKPKPAGVSGHARHVADYRRRHRRQQHEQAHAEPSDAADAEARPPLDDVPAGRPELVTDQRSLDALVARLRESGRFAYDTEFIGEMSYRPLVCLVQVATAGEIALIDPLADVSLDGFWDLLADPSLEKIVHAGEQDLEHVWRAIDQPPANVIDTQIVGGFVGLGYPASLAKLVLEFADLKLHKGFTFTDWSVRPLTPSQLKYAADDVRFLLSIESQMRERLTELARLDWAIAECADRCANGRPGFDPEEDWPRVRGSGSLDGRGVNVLKLLIAWRDACAEHADVPPRTFLKDEILIDLCRTRPKTLDRLASIRHLPRPVVEQSGRDLIEMVERGLAMPPAAIDRDPDGEPKLGEKFVLDSVWALVQTLCAGRSLDAQLVTSRQETIDTFRKLRRGDDASGERLMNGWRRLAIGEDLRAMAAGTFDAKLAFGDRLTAN